MSYIDVNYHGDPLMDTVPMRGDDGSVTGPDGTEVPVRIVTVEVFDRPDGSRTYRFHYEALPQSESD